MWTIVRTSKSCYHCFLRMFAFHFISSWIWVSLGYDLGYGCGCLGYLGSHLRLAKPISPSWRQNLIFVLKMFHLEKQTWWGSNLSSNCADLLMLEVMANRKWRSTRHLAICKLCNVAFEYNTASWTPIPCTASLLSRNKSCDRELNKKASLSFEISACHSL